MRNPRRWLSACALVALGWFIAHLAPVTGADPQQAKNPPQPVNTAADKSNVLAVVNNETITRQDLGEELIARFGKAQLELLINRRIIQQAAEKAHITVTDEEVTADLRDVMKLGQFRTEKEFEEHFLKKEKNCTLYEYKEDVVKPGLIMKKLAGQRLNVTEDEIRKAFDAKFGERIQCRIILEQTEKVALNTYAEIITSKEGIARAFWSAAKRQPNIHLAAVAGQVTPVGRNMTEKILEDTAFKLRDGEISEVLRVQAGYVIMLREQVLPPDDKHTYASERETLRLELLDKKMRAEVPKIFAELKKTADVQDFLNKKDSRGLKEVVGQGQK
jgi:parvulin-like peptidyl-prolyl isomerase